MTQNNNHERLTRKLAYMLRHQPEEFDVEVDKFGFADLEDVLDALSEELDEDIEDGIETYHTDPVRDELMAFIDALNEEEQINLVALVWMGRGDFVAVEWSEALDAARDARSDHTDTYLLGIPLLGDYLEEALATLGYDYEA